MDGMTYDGNYKNQIKSVALFFCYAFLEESIAQHAISKTVHKLKKSLEKQNLFTTPQAAVVYWTHRMWKEYSRRARLVNVNLGRICQLPREVDLEPWKQLKKDILPEEFLALIWTNILDFTDDQVAEGMNTSPGTIRHRVGIALRKLGQLAQSGRAHASKRN